MNTVGSPRQITAWALCAVPRELSGLSPAHRNVDTGRRVVDVFRLPAGDAVLVVTGVSDPVSIRLNSAQATLLAASLLTAVEAERLPPAMWLEDGAT